MAFPLGQTPDRIEDVSAERERLGLRRDAELERREHPRAPWRCSSGSSGPRPTPGARAARCPAADGAMPPCSFRGSTARSPRRAAEETPAPRCRAASPFSLFEPVGDERRKDPADRRGASGERLRKGEQQPGEIYDRPHRGERSGEVGAAALALLGGLPLEQPPVRDPIRQSASTIAETLVHASAARKERPRENARQLAAETVQRGAFEAHLPPVAKEDAKTVPEHRQEENEQRAERGQARHGVRKEKPCAERREKADRQQRAPEGIEKAASARWAGALCPAGRATADSARPRASSGARGQK